MGKPAKGKTVTNRLRRKAEARLKRRPKNLPQEAPGDVQNLIHELHVHQAELEMQNEELRRAQAEIEESRTRYTDLFDFAPVPYFVFDRNGIIAETNIKAGELLGLDRKALIGKPFLRFVGAEDRHIFHRHRLDTLRQPGRQRCDLRLARKDGAVLDVVLESFAPDHEREGFSHIHSAIWDVTELREKKRAARDEHAFREAIERSLAIGIAAVDAEGRQSYVNPTFSRMVGWSREELLGKMPPFIYWAPEEMEKVWESFRSVLSSKNTTGSLELRYRRRSGELFDAQVLFSALHDGRGQRLGWIMSVGDISKIKQNALEIRRLNEELEERVRQRTSRLQEINAQLEAVLESLPVGVAINDARGGILRVNRGFGEVWGTGYPKEVSSIEDYKRFRAWWADTGEILRPEEWASARVSLEGKAVLGQILKVERFDGARIFVHNSAAPIRDEEGRIVGSVVAIQDITGLRRAEAELRESERRWRQLAEAMPNLVWTCTPEGECDYLSPQWIEYTGIPEVEQLGFGWLDQVHPEDRHPLMATWNGAVKAEVAFDTEFRIRRYDGAWRWFKTRALPIRDNGGRVVKWYGSNTDIEDIKRAGEALRGSEARFRLQAETAERMRLVAAVEQAVTGIAILDPGGAIVFVNQAFERTARHQGPALLGNSYYEILAGDRGDPALARELSDILRAGGEWKGHIRRKKEKGQPYELEVTLTAIRDRSGKATHYLAVERDITEEFQLQQKLRQMQKMEALGTLAGGIAHDFNNLLNPIFLNTELALMDYPPGSKARETLQMVLQAAARGKDLVKQIIAFSRPREQERRPMKADPLVKEVLKFLRSTLPRTVEIREKYQRETGFILSDPSLIHQVVMNVCTNAAYSMRERGGLLDVGLKEVVIDPNMAPVHPDLTPGPYLQLTVADTGTGMTAEVMERAFDPFFTTKKPGEGSGMGLAVVHGIVTSHGGAVLVESEAGKGSVFRVFFPLVKSAESLPDSALALIPTGRERILLVDDEAMQVQSVQGFLKSLGYAIVGKTDSLEALALFRKDPRAFDLVITDQTMPGMTGMKLAEELLRTRPDIPVILCTGFSETVDATEAKKIGIRQFLMKPFSIGDMAESVRQALERK